METKISSLLFPCSAWPESGRTVVQLTNSTFKAVGVQGWWRLFSRWLALKTGCSWHQLFAQGSQGYITCAVLPACTHFQLGVFTACCRLIFEGARVFCIFFSLLYQNETPKLAPLFLCISFFFSFTCRDTDWTKQPKGLLIWFLFSRSYTVWADMLF